MLAAQPQGNTHSCSTIVCSGYPSYPVTSISDSTHTRAYPNMRIVSWDVRGEAAVINQRVAAKLGAARMEHIGSGVIEAVMLCKGGKSANRRFGTRVLDVVQKALCSAGTIMLVDDDLCGKRKEDGIPDYVLQDKDGIWKILAEGKTPRAMGELVDLATAELTGNQQGCAEQSCSYLRDNYRIYGFLFRHDAVYFIKRVADDTYAFSPPITPEATGPSVMELIVYLWCLAEDAACWPPAVVDQQPAQQGVPDPWVRRLHPRLIPEATVVPPTQPGSQPQASSSSSSRRVRQRYQGTEYVLYEEAALKMTDEVLGSGLCGDVRVGRLDEEDSAVKMVDTCKERDLLEYTYNEINIYGKLRTLQGSVIPVLHGYGYWRYGAIFFLAMSVVDGEQPERSTVAAWPVAQNALTAIHDLGVLHGDIRAANILVQPDGNNWKVSILDFGQSRVVDPEECREERIAEMDKLHSLFHWPFDDSDATGVLP